MAARLAVALSGGGHRAALFALGGLLYLADAGKTRDVTSVASVSGGSLANGVVAQDVDLATASPADLRAAASRAVRCIAGRGTLFGAPVVWAYLIGITGLALLVAVGPWFLPIAIGWRVLVAVAGVMVLGWLAGLRGRVAALAFGATLFDRDGRRTRLSDLHGGIDHVFCATELQSGEHVCFGRDMVYGYRFGLGTPGDLPLAQAVQASAAFPGAFPVTRLRTARFAFRDGLPEAHEARTLALHDGGVYDNMADQWAQGLEARNARFGGRFRGADELVVASASAGLRFGPLRRLGLPIAGELLTLLRDKSVLYDNGNSVRRRELVARFDLAARDGRGLRGVLVHIEQSPFTVPDAFAAARERWPDRAARAAAAQALLLAAGADPVEERARWAAIARANARMPTTLVGFKRDETVRILHHAYVLAMINCHVVLGHPLLPAPDPSSFHALLRE